MDDYYTTSATAAPPQELESNGGSNLDIPSQPQSSSTTTNAAVLGTGGDHSKIFVGALSWQTTEESLRIHFDKYGPVQSVEVVRDRHTGGM